MKTKEIITVLETLIGNIDPYGDSSIDEKHLKNIKQYREVCEHMINVLDNMSYTYRDWKEDSVRKIRDEAYQFMKEQHFAFKEFEENLE